MPRRDVVLTGLIAFAAGCAVGANWPKIRKKIGPMIGKAGMQISELGEFLSETFPDAESFFNAAAEGGANGAFDAHTRMAQTNGVHKNGHTGKARTAAKTRPARKGASRRKPVETSIA